jgi:hypothetical protein
LHSLNKNESQIGEFSGRQWMIAGVRGLSHLVAPLTGV